LKGGKDKQEGRPIISQKRKENHKRRRQAGSEKGTRRERERKEVRGRMSSQINKKVVQMK